MSLFNCFCFRHALGSQCTPQASGWQSVPHRKAVQIQGKCQIQWFSWSVLLGTGRESNGCVWYMQVHTHDSHCAQKVTYNFHNPFHFSRNTSFNKAGNDLELWPIQGQHDEARWTVSSIITTRRCRSFQCKEAHVQDESIWQSIDVLESVGEYSLFYVASCFHLSWKISRWLSTVPLFTRCSCQRNAWWEQSYEKTTHWSLGKGKLACICTSTPWYLEWYLDTCSKLLHWHISCFVSSDSWCFTGRSRRHGHSITRWLSHQTWYSKMQQRLHCPLRKVI